MGVAEGGRVRLLRAAKEQFMAQSYAETGVAKILSSCRLQPPTLYYHFGDKEGLYMAFLEEVLAVLGERIRVAASSESSVDHGLLTAATALMDPHEPDVIQIRRDAVQLARSENQERIHRMVFEAVYEPVMGILVRAASSGRIQGGAFDRMSQTFIMGALGLRPSYSLHPSDTVGAAGWWVERFLRGMAP